MPTPPRRRPAGPPTRRPRVAGLRKPARRPEAAAEDADTQDAAPAESGSPETSAPETAPDRSALPGDSTPPDDPAEPADAADVDPVVPGDAITAPLDENSDKSHEIETLLDVASQRPSPTGKRRATSRAVPADLRRAERSAGGRTRAKALDPDKRVLNVAIGLVVVALLCAGLGLWFRGQADRLTTGADRSNIAFSDPAATAEVKSKIVSGLERTLSFNYEDLESTSTAVREVLTGKALCEYDALFGQLKDLAPKQKLILTTVVREMGVHYLSADRAGVLVFIDQTSTRVDQDKTTAGAAQLGVTAERVDGTWKIIELDTFNLPLPSGKPMPQC